MPDTVELQKKASAICAVFKIDFRGRLVYIDDQTEELFGFGREELFGKSLYEFIDPGSIESIDEILKRHRRYDTFYEAMTMVLRLKSGEYQSFDAVVTLNFITGNPVNFQFTLLPGSSEKKAGQAEYQSDLLDILNTEPDLLEVSKLTSLISQTTGYREGHCYQIKPNDDLELVFSWPAEVPPRVGPAYLTQFLISGQDRYSFKDSDREQCDGFGEGKSEVVLFFKRPELDNLIVHLYGPVGYKPAAQRLELIRNFCGIWRQRSALLKASESVGRQLSLLGKTCDAVGLAVLISDSSGEVLFHNTILDKLIGSPENNCGLNQFLDDMRLSDVDGKPINIKQWLADRTNSAVQFESFSSNVGNYYIASGEIRLNNDNLQAIFILPENKLEINANNNLDNKTNDLLAVAHDLNAPLITIESFARHLQKNLDKKLSSDDRFALSSIVENSSALTRMLKGLKEISSFRASTDPDEKLSLPAMIKQIVKALRAAYPDVSYEVAIEKNLPFINAPRHKIERIFRNLLDNSFKYSASVKSPRITVKIKPDDDRFELEFSDNGPGIEAEYQTKVFEPFFRCPETMILPGTGIGLAISRDISHSLGGDILLAPSKSGAKFILSLPMSILQVNPVGKSMGEG